MPYNNALKIGFLAISMVFAATKSLAFAQTSNLPEIRKVINTTQSSSEKNIQVVSTDASLLNVSLTTTADIGKLLQQITSVSPGVTILMGVDADYLSNAIKSSTEYDLILLMLKKASKDHVVHLYLVHGKKQSDLDNIVKLAVQTDVLFDAGINNTMQVAQAVDKNIGPNSRVFLSVATLPEKNTLPASMDAMVLKILSRVYFAKTATDYVNVQQEKHSFKLYRYDQKSHEMVFVRKETVEPYSDHAAVQVVGGLLMSSTGA